MKDTVAVLASVWGTLHCQCLSLLKFPPHITSPWTHKDATADPKEGGGGDSDMEGWADDGWGAFDGCSGGHNRTEEEEERREKERNEPTHVHSGWPSTSTGADFFDSFGGGGGGGRGSGSRSVSEGRRLKEPPQWRSGSSQPPPPVSASLFDSKPSPSPPPPLPPPLSPPSQSPAPLDGGGSLEEKADGWDEWGDHDTAFEVRNTIHTHTVPFHAFIVLTCEHDTTIINFHLKRFFVFV